MKVRSAYFSTQDPSNALTPQTPRLLPPSPFIMADNTQAPKYPGDQRPHDIERGHSVELGSGNTIDGLFRTFEGSVATLVLKFLLPAKCDPLPHARHLVPAYLVGALIVSLARGYISAPAPLGDRGDKRRGAASGKLDTGSLLLSVLALPLGLVIVPGYPLDALMLLQAFVVGLLGSAVVAICQYWKYRMVHFRRTCGVAEPLRD